MNDLQNTPATTATIDEELVAYLDGQPPLNAGR